MVFGGGAFPVFACCPFRARQDDDGEDSNKGGDGEETSTPPQGGGAVDNSKTEVRKLPELQFHTAFDSRAARAAVASGKSKTWEEQVELQLEAWRRQYAAEGRIGDKRKVGFKDDRPQKVRQAWRMAAP